MKPDYKPPQFTPREKEIMTLTAQGKTSLEISILLTPKLKEPTVKKHIKSACQKLNANNKTHAIAIAVTLGLIAAVHTAQLHVDEA